MERRSIKRVVDLWVEEAAHGEAYNLNAGDEVQFGPALGAGLNFKPILGFFRYPTVLLFAAGEGVATVKVRALNQCTLTLNHNIP